MTFVANESADRQVVPLASAQKSPDSIPSTEENCY